MNVKRFVGKNAREAMAQVRATWGDDAVVLSNRPIPGGVEILAMAAGESVPTQASAASAVPAASPAASAHPRTTPPMSTLSFERFVRERQQREQQAQPAPALAPEAPVPAPRRAPVEPGRFAAAELREELMGAAAQPERTPAPSATAAQAAAAYLNAREAAPDASSEAVMSELRALRGMISSQLSSLSWFDTVRRSPAQTQMLRLLIANGFSPALARQLVGKLPAGHDETQAAQWLREVLARNLHCAQADAIGEQGGVFALVGPTGVGKTTTTAKIAANFALRHGAASVGLITVDTYRMAASDQLRAFGRILSIPVHTARDAASLGDLLGLFEHKKLVLIDTVGIGQRDRRMNELFDALPADRVQRLLVLNASAQAETLEEVAQAYGARPGLRCVISKLDEAVKVGAVVDLAIRHRLRVEGMATGQRVPEDWHAAHASLLVEKALMKPRATIFTPDDGELGLMLTSPSAFAGGLGLEAGHA